MVLGAQKEYELHLPRGDASIFSSFIPNQYTEDSPPKIMLSKLYPSEKVYAINPVPVLTKRV